ncbi:unnamed protein product [Malus baccata var. baccata]
MEKKIAAEKPRPTDTKGKECLHVGFCDLGLNKSASVLPGSSTPKLRMKGSIAVYHVQMIREGAIPSEELHLQKSSWVVNCDWKCLIHVVAFEFRSNARTFLLLLKQLSGKYFSGNQHRKR